MHSSPVAFRKPPPDDVRVQLIGESYGRLEPTTPDSSEVKPASGQGKVAKWDLRHLYHKVFSNQDLQKASIIFFRILNYLPIFIITISILEITISTKSTPRTRKSLNFDPQHKDEFYRFLTYMLVHANITHMAMNVLIQVFLGTPLELEQGTVRAAAIYIGGGLGGSLGSSVIEPTTVVEGASAGVYAILMAQISHIILNYPDLRYKRTRGAAVAVLLTADIAHASYHVYTWGNSEPRISIPAHVCGAITGILLGLLIFRGTSRWTRVIKIISGAMLFIIYGTAILRNILHSTVISH